MVLNRLLMLALIGAFALLSGCFLEIEGSQKRSATCLAPEDFEQ